jgi:hypothetical protein
MVASYRAARRNRFLAADALLAVRGITNPTDQQQVGALIEAEYMLKVSRFIGGD